MPEGQFECPVCYGFFNEEDMFGLSCGHKQCKTCIADYLAVNVTEGQVLKIKCMEAGCPMTYDQDDIRKFGSQDIYTKYLRFHENIIVDLNPKLRWCSQPGCLSYVEKAKKKNQPSICQCGFEMCFKCG